MLHPSPSSWSRPLLQVCGIFLLASAGIAAPPSELETLTSSFWQKLDALTETTLQRHGELVEGYLSALRKEAETAESSGDAAVKSLATGEIARIEAHDLGSSALAKAPPGSNLAGIRDAFATEYGKVRDEFAIESEKLGKVYRTSLETMLQTYRDAGDPEAVEAIRKSLGQLDGEESFPWASEEGSIYLSFDQPPTDGNGWEFGSVRCVPMGSPQLVEGKRGRAIQFPNKLDYLDFKEFEISPSFTIAAWFRCDEHNWWSTVFKCSESRNEGDVIQICRPNGEPRVFFEVQGSFGMRTQGELLQLGRWIHVIGTVQDGEFATLYINGAFQHRKSGIRATPDRLRSYARIGQTIHDGGEIGSPNRTGALPGLVDDFLYLPRSITDEEALAIFRTCGGGKPEEAGQE